MIAMIQHVHRRGISYQYYQDNNLSLGFSGRAAYALGMDKPNYPVPAIIFKVRWGAIQYLTYARPWVSINRYNGRRWYNVRRWYAV